MCGKMAMFEKDEMDILKEVGTTAAAHGSMALSEILKKRINLQLPSVDIIPCENLKEKINVMEMAITLQTQILSGLKGKILLVLSEKNAFKLIDMCYKTNEKIQRGSVFTEIGLSLIREVGSIIIAAYISALAFFIKKPIIPTLPVLINASFEEILKIVVIDYDKEDYVLAVESIFEDEKENINGTFWLILPPKTAEEIQIQCKRLLENI